MKPDKITLSTATVGLLTGAMRLIPAGAGKNPARPAFSCGGQKGYLADPEFEASSDTPMRDAGILDYLKNVSFHQACRAAASVIGDMSLRAPDNYDKLLEGVSAAGSVAMAATAPQGALWPDAVTGMFPGLRDGSAMKDNYFRMFNLPQAAALLSADDPGMDPDAVAAWCAENPGALLRSEPMGDGNLMYAGWNAATGSVAVFWCVCVDLSRPWCVDRMPDGSEIISLNIRPGRVADPVLNLCEDLPAVPGAYLAISCSYDATEILAFPDRPSAEGYLIADFESERHIQADENGNAVDHNKSLQPTGGLAILKWTGAVSGEESWIRWDVVDSADMQHMVPPGPDIASERSV